MNKELKEVCENTAVNLAKPMLRDMISRGEAYEMCMVSFKGAIESEQVKGLVEALEFYAGQSQTKEQSLWEGSRFLGFNKFGGLDHDLSGPLLAKKALEKFRGNEDE